MKIEIHEFFHCKSARSNLFAQNLASLI